MHRRQENEPRLGWKDAFLILAIIGLLAATIAFQVAHAASPRAPTLSAVLDHAAQLYEKRDYAGAQREYERATQMDPGSIPAWRGLGSSLWQQGEHDRAMQVWNDILKVRPDDPDILLEMGNAEASQQHWEQAFTLYGRVLELRPRRTSAMIARARVNMQNGQFDAAEPDLRRVLQLAPQNVEALFLLAQVCKATNRDDEAAQIYQRLGRQGGAGHRYPREMADVFLELDRPAEAVPLYQQNLGQNPDNRGTVLGLARAHARLHEYGPAMDRLEAYLDKHPDDAKIREELARFANSGGDYDRAEKHLRVLVKDHPEESKWRVSLAQTLRNEGELAAASKLANELLAEDPDNIACLEILLHAAMMSGDKVAVAHAYERLAGADPNAKRLNRVGQAYSNAGDELALKGQAAAARENFVKAADAFRRAGQLDPLSADAREGEITAQRLAGNYALAIVAAQKVVDGWPSAEWGWRELYEAHLEQNDYAEADRLMKERLKRDPGGGIRLRQEMARARFKKGEHAQAIADLQKLLQEPLRPGVPVLLYHGLTEVAPTDESMPVKTFREQMEALKDNGYTPITMQQLWAFYHQGAALPNKPILITFDDARADSFRYADPVLQEVGFKATMFTPVSEVGQHGDFNLLWPDLRNMNASGRWEIQCHSYWGHSLMPVAAGGSGGIFLANRKWLDEAKRLETRAEFSARLEDDYRSCATELHRQLPGLSLLGYAYPFGEMGQKSLSNEPQAVQINTALVQKYYQIGFVQDPAAVVTRLSPAAALPRFEVPWDFTGKDLIHHLRSIDAYASTQMALADLYSWDGRYADARKILKEVRESGGVDDATVLARRGQMEMWQGDFAGARRDLNVATALRADPATEQGVAQIDKRTRPRLAFDSEGSQDNHDRQSLIGGPQQEVHINDRLALSAAYRYRLLDDDAFDQTKVDPSYTGGPVALRAIGSEREAALTYRWNWRAMLSLGGGVAKFDDDSSAPVFAQESQSFHLASLDLDVPIGDLMDVAVRGRRSYAPAAGAVLGGLGLTSGEGRWQFRPLQDTIVEARLLHGKYSDGNDRVTGSAQLMQRLIDAPELQIGYRFRYDDTRAVNPYFYSPQRYTGNDAVLKLATKTFQYNSFEFEAAGGYGHEAGADSQFESTLTGTWRLEIPDRFGLYLGGGRDQAAQYSSVGATLGFVVTF